MPSDARLPQLDEDQVDAMLVLDEILQDLTVARLLRNRTLALVNHVNIRCAQSTNLQ